MFNFISLIQPINYYLIFKNHYRIIVFIIKIYQISSFGEYDNTNTRLSGILVKYDKSLKTIDSYKNVFFSQKMLDYLDHNLSFWGQTITKAFGKLWKK